MVIQLGRKDVLHHNYAGEISSTLAPVNQGRVRLNDAELISDNAGSVKDWKSQPHCGGNKASVSA